MPNGDPVITRELAHADQLLINGTNSTPSINGWWFVRDVDNENRTALLASPSDGNNIFNIEAVWKSVYNRGRPEGADTGILEWQSNQWSDGTTGHAVWEPNLGCEGPEHQ